MTSSSPNTIHTRHVLTTADNTDDKDTTSLSPSDSSIYSVSTYARSYDLHESRDEDNDDEDSSHNMHDSHDTNNQNDPHGPSYRALIGTLTPRSTHLSTTSERLFSASSSSNTQIEARGEKVGQNEMPDTIGALTAYGKDGKESALLTRLRRPQRGEVGYQGWPGGIFGR